MTTILPAVKADQGRIIAITSRIELFTPEERECVKELWDDYLANGGQSPYQFFVSRDDSLLLGYACVGKHALTAGTYDLYWIAVDPDFQGKGIGRALLSYVEELVISLGGNLLVVETSSTAAYKPTREFYKSCHYKVSAVLRDFYSAGDDLVIFTKQLAPHARKALAAVS